MFFTVSMCYSQNLRQIENNISINKEQAMLELNTIDTTKLSIADRAYYYYIRAEIFDLKNNDDLAFKNYITSKKLYRQADSIDQSMRINLKLAYIIRFQNNRDSINYKKYLNEYLQHFKNNKDPLISATALADLATLKLDNKEDEESFIYFKEAKNLNKKINNKKLNSVISTNLAVIFNEYLNKPDSALYYLNKDLPYLKEVNDNYGLSINYVNQAAAYYYLGNSKKAITMLNMANNIPLAKFVKRTKTAIYQYLSINYAELGDHKNAYENLLLHKIYEDSLNTDFQNIAISEMHTKYQTREKELENQVLKSKHKTNKALLYIFIGLLLASLIIAFLIIKNVRRKEKISRQEKLIEQQKLEKALKDYELSSIDLMLEGQEKERQRIANDLHDNLGSMLATLKMNFEHLKLRKNELRDEETKLYERTDELIEEAYQKVRRLAHAKNAGVFANEGLIPAIKKMAGKISIPGKLQIQVIPFGFNDRLENTLEIAIFRMIQELSTNIIKHSKATEASIHLTHHDDNINIIIEDNGIGFDSSKINTADGMGLSNIKKKVEQLGGSLSIDSTPGKGTNIIIDLPV